MSASTITAGNEDLLLARSQSVPDNLSVSYKAEGGLHVVSGHGCILTDADGHRYLDAVNNVAHVGHSNPHVHQALATQHAKLNTNTRYLNPQLATYTRRLLDLCPPPLSHGRCFLVASGSEANDLAMRLCRAHVDAKRKKEMEGTNSHEPADSEWKQKQVFVCLSYGYHGATDSVVDISPYKYRSKGGHGQPANVIEIGVPSAMDDEQQIRRELDILQQQVDAAVASGKDICGFFAESVLVTPVTQSRIARCDGLNVCGVRFHIRAHLPLCVAIPCRVLCALRVALVKFSFLHPSFNASIPSFAMLVAVVWQMRFRLASVD